MSKNFLKKDNVIITSKRTFYLKLACILLIVFLSSIIFSMYTNSYILKSHKESYIANAELNNKINSLRDEIIRNKDYIKKLEASNKEINNVFNRQ